MATWRPDPSFYPSPRMAMAAPAEKLAYTFAANRLDGFMVTLTRSAWPLWMPVEPTGDYWNDLGPYRASLIAVLDPSPQRVDPACRCARTRRSTAISFSPWQRAVTARRWTSTVRSTSTPPLVPRWRAPSRVVSMRRAPLTKTCSRPGQPVHLIESSLFYQRSKAWRSC